MDPLTPDPFKLEPRDRATVLVHYYRAMVTRSDMWRVRMDTTTNWAVGTTAAVLSFALGEREVPHSVIFVATLLSLGFLQLETRRLRFYHLWQQRVIQLELGMIRPALVPSTAPPPEWEKALALELGTTVPGMPRIIAVARRLRRIYLWLFGVQLISWLFKLNQHPQHITRWREAIDRAHVAFFPGELVLGVVGAAYLFAVALAVFKGGVGHGHEDESPQLPS